MTYRYILPGQSCSMSTSHFLRLIRSWNMPYTQRLPDYGNADSGLLNSHAVIYFTENVSVPG